MSKTFVLDTNVLLHDPNAIFAFGNNTVAIPIFVLEELDNFKKAPSDLGRNAREFCRVLDALRASGLLDIGVELPGGGIVRVITHQGLPNYLLETEKVDNHILSTALEYRQSPAGAAAESVVLISKDINMRIRAAGLGLLAEDYQTEKVELSDLYTGSSEILITEDTLAEFFEKGALYSPGAARPNEYVNLKVNAATNVWTRYDGLKQSFVPMRKPAPVWGVKPRNLEQTFLFDLLLNDSIPLVTIVGQAGTGKTMLALAAGLQKVAEENVYQKLLVSRPIAPLGKDIGFLPGTVEEKMNPWMAPIWDNLEFLMTLSAADKRAGRSHQELVELGILQVEPLTYIRGRSIPKQLMVVDEAQNLTQHEIKTIITRAGEGTKIILTGDPNQIDNPYIDATNNGLVLTVNAFKDEAIAGHITLTQGERSPLAEIATKIL